MKVPPKWVPSQLKNMQSSNNMQGISLRLGKYAYQSTAGISKTFTYQIFLPTRLSLPFTAAPKSNSSSKKLTKPHQTSLFPPGLKFKVTNGTPHFKALLFHWCAYLCSSVEASNPALHKQSHSSGLGRSFAIWTMDCSVEYLCCGYRLLQCTCTGLQSRAGSWMSVSQNTGRPQARHRLAMESTPTSLQRNFSGS